MEGKQALLSGWTAPAPLSQKVRAEAGEAARKLFVYLIQIFQAECVCKREREKSEREREFSFSFSLIITSKWSLGSLPQA